MPNKMRTIYPGEIRKDELTELGMSANAFAQEIAVPANLIAVILKQERAVSADAALRFAAFFKFRNSGCTSERVTTRRSQSRTKSVQPTIERSSAVGEAGKMVDWASTIVD